MKNVPFETTYRGVIRGALHANGVEVFKLATVEQAQRFALLLQGRKANATVRGRFVHVSQ